MFQRSLFISGLFGVAALSTGAAVWQSLETNLREEQLSEASQLLTAARNEARTFKDKAHLAERQVRALEAAKQAAVRDAVINGDAKLRAELAAAKQQLSATETAMQETEDRLAEEIADHAELKAKAQEMMDEVAAASRANSTSEATAAPDAPSAAKSAAAVEQSATVATGSLPDNAQPADTSAAPVAEKQAIDGTRAAVKKSPPRRSAKPAIKAVEPLGGTFDPML